MHHRLLIISNSVLSHTRGNGKTILSFFDTLPKECIRQLYFSGEVPGVSGYKYYQLSDYDILRGLLNQNKRGRSFDSVTNDIEISTYSYRSNKIKTPFFRLARELLWYNKWKSNQLLRWLDEFNPTNIFFVGGDSIFAYDICEYITNKYNARLSLFLTDDYVLPRKNESFLYSIRRKLITHKMRKCINKADVFFSISEQMRKEYKKMFGKDSITVVNMTDSLENEKLKTNEERENTRLVYAGGLYYGREDVISKLAQAIEKYNKLNPEKKAELRIYTNLAPIKEVLNKIEIKEISTYCGSLTPSQLALELNNADILVFVESFDDSQIEKTRLSLSTKISEYLSLGKPILAIGPSIVGSIDYLSDVAACAYNVSEIDSVLNILLNNIEYQRALGLKAKKKYYNKHNKSIIQKEIVDSVFGGEL